MTASGMASKDLMEFSRALKYLDQMQVTDYLYKISDYLKKNTRELFFPNISVVDEAFLVNLVNDTRNLSNKSMNNDPENRELVLDIIETLEMNRDVFRWTYTYENGRTNKKLKVGSDILVYQKIYTNKINKKPAEFKKPSRISQRLVQAQSNQSIQVQIQNATLQPFSKIQLLNMTLRFIKNDDERTLLYPEMPLSDAQYIYSLLVNPKKNLSVGFGYKSMTAPLFEAMDAYRDDYKFRILLVETGKCETSGLKLEKIPRKTTNNSSRDDNSETSSSASSTRLDVVSEAFVARTLSKLLKFTSTRTKHFVVLDNLSIEELDFVKGVKELAASNDFGVYDAQFRDSLIQLNKNVAKVVKNFKIRIEEKPHKKSNARWIKLYKVPRDCRELEPESPPSSAAASERLLASVSKGRSESSTSVRERSLSRNRQISFKSGGQLLLPKDKPKLPQPDETAQSAEKETIAPRPRCLSNERLNKRKTKLLEDMSTPIESDKGRRMMMLMGWKGGALGARGDGILEPIVPTIERPVYAGLGHVPPPKPAKATKAGKAAKPSNVVCAKNAIEFRVSVLHNILDLLLHQADTKTVEYKTELTKKERRWISNTLRALNDRVSLACDREEETALEEPLQVEMHRDLELWLAVEIAPDMRKLILTKSTVPPTPTPEPKPSKIKPKTKKGHLDDIVFAALKPPRDATKPITDLPIVMTVLNTSKEYELITEDDIDRIVTRVIPMINSSCKTPMAIRARAVKILLLMRITAFVKSAEWTEREFRFENALPKKIRTFINDIVLSANLGIRSGFVTPEELPWYQELQAGAELLQLTVTFYSDTRLILKKKDRPTTLQYRSRFTNSAMLSMERNNNLRDDEPNLAQNDWASELKEYYHDVEAVDNNTKETDPEERRIENEIDKVLTEVEAEIESDCDVPEYRKRLTDSEILENNNDLSTDDQNLIQSDWVRELKELYDSIEGLDNINKEIEDPEEIALENETEKELTDSKDKIESISDLEHNDEDVNDTGTETVKKLETDESSDDSLCVCDKEVDVSQLEKEIQDLELAMHEVNISIDTKDDEDKASSKRSRSSSENLEVTDAKRTKSTEIDNAVIITTNNDIAIDLNMVKEIQTCILNAIEKTDNFLPLLKCFGVRNGGLVYSCHDDNDIAWLKDVIGDMDLNINKYDDDFGWVPKSRKMVVKINSFIPLDRKKVFRSIEKYNEGLHTEKWKVLIEETSRDFVLFIIQVDEKSFKYISKENFALYFGIDKAHFSIIH